MHWSEQPIVWSREDHPPRVDNPGHLALYYETFQRIGLTDKNLKPSNTVFHGVVLGKSVYPVCKIALEVAFGDDYDSRSETLTIEVVKIKSPYHALFRRPAYAKFMARPCYVYLQLKMPGHKGTITVHGSRKIALDRVTALAQQPAGQRGATCLVSLDAHRSKTRRRRTRRACF